MPGAMACRTMKTRLAVETEVCLEAEPISDAAEEGVTEVSGVDPLVCAKDRGSQENKEATRTVKMDKVKDFMFDQGGLR